jgi:hypothetical protein
VPSAAVSAAATTAAGPASTTTSATAAARTTASAPTTISTAGPISRTSASGPNRALRRITVEVGFVIGEITTAFDSQGWLLRTMAFAVSIALSVAIVFALNFGSAHLRALFFQNRFTRKADSVSFDGQHFDQNLIAFFQFIADILDAMFSDFTDVQESIGTGNDFDERAEIRQT